MKNIVQVFGRKVGIGKKLFSSIFYQFLKKSSIAIAVIKGPGSGYIRVNGLPLDLIEPEILRFKAFEPILLLGNQGFGDVDIRIRVRGGGLISQIYAIRQAIARGIVKYVEKFVSEKKRAEIKDIFLNFDRSILIRDSRCAEPKKAGGRGARARFQKSYR